MPRPADGRNRFAQGLFTPLPGRYDRLEAVLSLGQNERWRRAMVDRVAGGGRGLILDGAPGTRGGGLELPRRAGARVVGVALTEPMLREGQTRVAAAGMARPPGSGLPAAWVRSGPP